MLEETIKKIPRTNAARTIPPNDHLDVIFDEDNRVIAGYGEQVLPSVLQYYEGRQDLSELPRELQCIQMNDLLSMSGGLLDSGLFEEVFSSIGVQRELRMGFGVTTGPIAEIRKKYCEDQPTLTLVDSLLAVYQQSR